MHIVGLRTAPALLVWLGLDLELVLFQGNLVRELVVVVEVYSSGRVGAENRGDGEVFGASVEDHPNGLRVGSSDEESSNIEGIVLTLQVDSKPGLILQVKTNLHLETSGALDFGIEPVLRRRSWIKLNSRHHLGE